MNRRAPSAFTLGVCIRSATLQHFCAWDWPRSSLTSSKISPDQLLAKYWLNIEAFQSDAEYGPERLKDFVRYYDLDVTDDATEQVELRLDRRFVDGNPDSCEVTLCFFGHPHTIWNFIIDAILAAETEDHLSKIAAGPAGHLLAYYGSMIPYFEKQAKFDKKFARMLTGVRRLKMSDDVWRRLRKIQLAQPADLNGGTVRDLGEDWQSDMLSDEDRRIDDKGRWRRRANGRWTLGDPNQSLVEK